MLRFSDTLACLHNTKINIFELLQVLKNIRALPTFYIGIVNAIRVIPSHLIGQFQYFRVEAHSVVEQGGPDEAGE